MLNDFGVTIPKEENDKVDTLRYSFQKLMAMAVSRGFRSPKYSVIDLPFLLKLQVVCMELFYNVSFSHGTHLGHLYVCPYNYIPLESGDRWSIKKEHCVFEHAGFGMIQKSTYLANSCYMGFRPVVTVFVFASNLLQYDNSVATSIVYGHLIEIKELQCHVVTELPYLNLTFQYKNRFNILIFHNCKYINRKMQFIFSGLDITESGTG